MSEQENPLRDYPVVIQLPVLWGHMDAFQHVNNVIYYRYFESVRIVYGDKIKMFKYLQEDKIGPILAASSCNFLKPLRYPDTIDVGCRTTRISESEMDQEYGLFSQEMQKIAAVGTAKIVAYDYNTFRRTVFPQPLIERILQLEKNLQMS
jgi:acyl-CoA thioester hydrolase